MGAMGLEMCASNVCGLGGLMEAVRGQLHEWDYQHLSNGSTSTSTKRKGKGRWTLVMRQNVRTAANR